MKKLFLLFALFGVLAVSCEELFPTEQKPVEKPTEQPEENQTFITDAEGNYIVNADGGEVIVIVATNLEYSIAIPEEAQSWLSVADTCAEERIDRCTFIVARNDSFDERSATAELIDTEGKVLQTITFVQNGQPKVFETDSEGNYRVVANGGEVEVAVTTNLEYSVVISDDAEEWLSVADTRVVIREDKLTFVVAVNESFDERSASAELVNGDGEVLQTITFIQDGQSKTFDSNGKDSYTIQAIGGEVNVVVTTNIEYNVNIPEAAQEWLSVADTRALVREETLTFIVAENETFEERSASVELVNGEGEVLQTIIFVQDGQAKVFESDGEGSYTIKAVGGEVSVAVTTNLEYSAVISEDAEEWLSIADTRAVIREETLTFIVAENKAYDRRSTTVALVDNEDNVLQTIEFIQRAAVMPQFACPADEIWYTNDSTTEPTKPYRTNVFGAKIISNTYSEDSERWVIKFDGDVTTVGERAFYYCSSLTSVTIPESVTTIGGSAFSGCSSLTSVTIPDGVTSIGSYTFDGCSSLTSVTIPDSVTTIGDRAFLGCSSLTSVTIPDSVTTIGKYAFYGCTGELIVNCNIPNAYYDGYTHYGAFCYSKFTSVTIGDSVTTIGDYAFCGCSSLTSVTIPDSITSIGDYAFRYCSSLTSVTIPDSVTTIGHGAFYGCESLEAVHITDLVSWCNIDFINPFTDVVGIDLTANPLCYARNLYLNGELVTDLVIPDGVNEIKLMAFALCESIKSVTIGNGVTTIGYWVFYNCTSLTSVTIGDGVTTIGYAAFEGCDSLTSVTIGDGVTTIEWQAFYECDSLTSVYCKATTPPAVAGQMFYMIYGIATGRKIYVPMESVKAYKSARGWSDYADDIVGYNF